MLLDAAVEAAAVRWLGLSDMRVEVEVVAPRGPRGLCRTMRERIASFGAHLLIIEVEQLHAETAAADSSSIRWFDHTDWSVPAQLVGPASPPELCGSAREGIVSLHP